MKGEFLFICCLFFHGNWVLAQETIVKGRLVDSYSSVIIEGVEISLEKSLLQTLTDEFGNFVFSGDLIPLGEQVLSITKQGYFPQRIPILIQKGTTVNLDPILLILDLGEVELQIGVIGINDTELAAENDASISMAGILQASNDVFINATAFDFSSTFFLPRGITSTYGKLLINGVEMNRMYTGRPQWGSWGGLNDMFRNQEFSQSLQFNNFCFGDLGRATNIIMRASQFRRGGRISMASANKTYSRRIMASYNSGLSNKGWAYSALISKRFGDAGYFPGTHYDANSFFGSIEKKMNETHSLNLTGFYTPIENGRSTAITNEAKNIKGNRYNPNWGYQDNYIRNSRIRSIEEPFITLNHFWKLGSEAVLNTNIAYQFGTIGNTRLDYGGTRLIDFNGQEAYIGGGRNPFGNYYQRMPSYFVRMASPSEYDYSLAYLAEQELVRNGQINWNSLYQANATLAQQGGNSIYVLQQDVFEDSQLSINSILNTKIADHIYFNGSLSYRGLKSENYALLSDLLGGNGYLDIDYFAEGESNEIITNAAQSDLQYKNRIASLGERYKYNLEYKSSILSGFAQSRFNYYKTDLYAGLSGSLTNYQRIGLYENGHFPGNKSLGPSEKLTFINYGVKGGATYKFTPRHIIDVNAGYLTKSPNMQNSFSNPRQNNEVVIDLKSENNMTADASYFFKSKIFKSKITGYYNTISNQTEINYYFTESARGQENGNAFLQEVLTNLQSRRFGGQLGVEAAISPALTFMGVASIGDNRYTNNPNQYFTSEDFLGVTGVTGIENDVLRFGEGSTYLENYHVAAGPERAYQVGLKYNSPDFWYGGISLNYFSNAYIDISTLRRSNGFTTNFRGLPFNDYNEEIAQELLRQEEFDAYSLVNLVGGKSWRLDQFYLGFFGTINNLFGTSFITGGFEDSRYADYRSVLEESRRAIPLFGSRYFFGTGTTYYLNFYIRF